jgi:hypothetical protein
MLLPSLGCIITTPQSASATHIIKVSSAVSDGRFGAYMQVSIQNDGPVTIELESPRQMNASDPQFDVV